MIIKCRQDSPQRQKMTLTAQECRKEKRKKKNHVQCLEYKSGGEAKCVHVGVPTTFCSDSKWHSLWMCSEAERTCYFQTRMALKT